MLKTGVVAFLILVLVSAIFVPIQAKTGGGAPIVTSSTTGCLCHSSDPGDGVTYSLEGLPDKYEPGREYNLTIFISDTETGRPELMGFSISASTGTVEVPDSSEDVQLISDDRAPESGEVTHTVSGSSNNNWTVIWKAPAQAEGDVTISLTVMIVNGDGAAGDGDRWQNAQFVINGEGGEVHAEEEARLGLPVPAYWLGMIGFIMVLVVVGFSFVVIKITHGRS